MQIFNHLLVQLIPLYLSVVLGYVAGRILRIDRDTIATLVFYLLAPLVFFSGVANTQLSLAVLSTPLLVYILACGMCLSTYYLAGHRWTDSTRNILAYTAGCGNTGYFGIPVALMLFDKQTEGIYILIVIGFTLYENSLGYFIAAKGQNSGREALLKLARLPTTYAFLLGLLFNYSGAPLPAPIQDFLLRVQGAYSILGMMIVGLGLGGLKRLALDFRFISTALVVRFVAWPTLMFSLVSLDRQLLHFYDNSTHQALLLSSIVPLAANMVVFASLLRAQPEKSATAVLISTLIGMIYVPLLASLWLM